MTVIGLGRPTPAIAGWGPVTKAGNSLPAIGTETAVALTMTTAGTVIAAGVMGTGDVTTMTVIGAEAMIGAEAAAATNVRR